MCLAGWGAALVTPLTGAPVRLFPPPMVCLRRVLVALACAVTAVALSAQPAIAAGDDETATGHARDARRQALAVAGTDSRVAAVLSDAGDAVRSRAVPWGGTAQEPAGVAVYYEWTEEINVAATWPLVKTAGSDAEPVAPYTVHERHLRIEQLTGLRVDVLAADSSIIRIAPVDAATRYELREETRWPLSLLSRFTTRPWLLAPVFVALGVVTVAHAWSRSRAWNRQTPSMTRYDRRFLGRVAWLVFLLAGLAWQIREAVIAATGPVIDPTVVGSGDLLALPVLLIPPGLFLAAFILKLSWDPHRVAWGLLAVLSITGSGFYLATAVTGTTTNLNVTYHVMLSILALLALPRAFSRGRMGWSHSPESRY